MQNMMVAMATIIQAVCRSDHDFSDDIKCALVFILLSNLVVLYNNDKECVNVIIAGQVLTNHTHNYLATISLPH